VLVRRLADSTLDQSPTAFRMEETIMSKGQRGNKEAKKPKKVPTPAPPEVDGLKPPGTSLAPPRHKR
jgi:hypothetical protein